MPTLAQVRTQIDAFLATLWPKIVARQLAYTGTPYSVQGVDMGGNPITTYRMRKSFFQGLRTHAIYPADGNTTAATLLASHPTDQASSWQDAVNTDIPGTWPAALVMDVYDGPLGKGFVGTVYVRVLGKVYSRSKGYGPEARDVGWHEIVVEV